MPREFDDDDDDDDRGRRRANRDDDDAPRGRGRRDDDDDDDRIRRRPRRNRRDDYDDDDDDDLDREDIGQNAGMRMLLPVGRSFWAIAAGYLGLLSVLCVFAPFALITGIIAVIEINRDSKKHGMGRAIFGIIMGGIFTVVLIIGIFALIAEKSRN